MIKAIGSDIIVLIKILISAIALLSSLAYTFYYKRKAQKTLDVNAKRSNLPPPLVFIFTTLLVASLIGNIFSVIGFSTSKYEENHYNNLSIGELSSEYQYIKDEVIKGLKAEYKVTSKKSEDFIIYYAKINDVIKDSTPFLPNFVIYIEYIGDELIEDNYNIKLTRSSSGYKSSSITRYRSDDSIMLLSSQEIVDL